jgi:hypothetical protein
MPFPIIAMILQSSSLDQICVARLPQFGDHCPCSTVELDPSDDELFPDSATESGSGRAIVLRSLATMANHCNDSAEQFP